MSVSIPEVPGEVHGAVAALVADQFDAGSHLGVQVAAVHRGELIVDIAEGWLDADHRRPVRPDSLFCCFSATKAVAAVRVWRLIDEGLIEPDRPMARYWHGFRASLTVAEALSHQGGLHRVPQPLTTEFLIDDQAGLNWVASLEPAWPPGTAGGYHTLTFGWLVRGLVEAVTGERFPQRLGPDVYVGLPSGEEPRAADIDELDEARGLQWIAGDGTEPTAHPAFEAMPASFVPQWNDPRMRHACQPAFSGWASARGLAEYFASIERSTLYPTDRAGPSALLFSGVDRCLELPVRRGLGVELGGRFDGDSVGALGPRESAFGHHGHGGQVIVCDPEVDLVIAVLLNLLPAPELAAERTTTICELIRALTDAY